MKNTFLIMLIFVISISTSVYAVGLPRTPFPYGQQITFYNISASNVSVNVTILNTNNSEKVITADDGSYIVDFANFDNYPPQVNQTIRTTLCRKENDCLHYDYNITQDDISRGYIFYMLEIPWNEAKFNQEQLEKSKAPVEITNKIIYEKIETMTAILEYQNKIIADQTDTINNLTDTIENLTISLNSSNDLNIAMAVISLVSFVFGLDQFLKSRKKSISS